jgi:hypothetical protein
MGLNFLYRYAAASLSRTPRFTPALRRHAPAAAALAAAAAGVGLYTLNPVNPPIA